MKSQLSPRKPRGIHALALAAAVACACSGVSTEPGTGAEPSSTTSEAIRVFPPHPIHPIPPPPPAVLTQRGDNGRSGTYTQPGFNSQLAGGPSWGLLGVLPVFGVINSQPLYVPNQIIRRDNRLHDVVYVATAMNRIYAFDADTLAPLWEQNRLPAPDLSLDRAPVVNPDPSKRTADGSPSSWMTPAYIEPNGIDPSLYAGLPAGVPHCADPGWSSNAMHGMGIHSTPVIDAARGYLYVSYRTEQWSGTTSTPVQHVAALDLASGDVVSDFAIPNAAFALPSEHMPADAPRVLGLRQRASLLLSQGVLYVAFAANVEDGAVFGDPKSGYQYMGQILAFSLSQGTSPEWSFVGRYQVSVPGILGGGIWQGSSGLVADADGSIYFVTGNVMWQPSGWDVGLDPKCSTTDTHGCQSAGDSVVRINPVLTHDAAGNVTQVTFPSGGPSYPPGAADFFMPYRATWQNKNDMDFAAAGATLIPGTRSLVAGGKEGVLYVLNRDNLGGYATTGRVTMTYDQSTCVADGSHLVAPATSTCGNANTYGNPSYQACENVPDQPGHDDVLQKFNAARNVSCPAPLPDMNDWQQWPHIHGTPVYADFPNGQSWLYVWPEKDYLHAFPRVSDVPTFDTATQAQSAMTGPLMTNATGRMPGGMLSLAIDPQSTGVLFASIPATDPSQIYVAGKGWPSGGAYSYGVLRAFDPLPGSNKSAAGTPIVDKVWDNSFGPPYIFATFVPPTLANQRVYLPTWSNEVLVYGAGGPAVPPGGGVAAISQTPNQITSVWVGQEGALYLDWESDNNMWHVPVRLTNPGFAPAGASVAFGWDADPNGNPEGQLDAFVVDSNGVLQVFSDIWGQGWTGPIAIANPSSTTKLRPGAGVATGIQGTSSGVPVLDVFVIDEEGNLDVAWHVPKTSWHALASIGSGFQPGGQMATGRQGITAVPPSGDVLDLFTVGASGQVIEMWLRDTYVGGWQRGTMTGNNFAAAGGGVATGLQGSATLDVFVVGSGPNGQGPIQRSYLVNDGPPTWSQFASPWPGSTFTSGASLATGTRKASVNTPASQGELDLFVVDGSGRLNVATLSGDGQGSLTAPQPVPQSLASSVAGTGGSIAVANQLPWVLDTLVSSQKGIGGYFSVNLGAWVPFPVY